MRLFVKVFAAIVALTFVSAIGLLLYLVFADLGKYKTDIEKGVLDATGFELSIGEFDLAVGGQTVMTASRVLVNNPEYAEFSQMASIGRLHIVIDTWSFLSDEVDLEVFELQDVEVSLHQQADGDANWQATPRQPQIPIPEEDLEQAELILHALNLANVSVRYEAAGQEPVIGRFSSLVLDRLSDGSMQYVFDGYLSTDAIETPVSGDGLFRAEDDLSLFTEGTFSMQSGQFNASASIHFDGATPSIKASLDSSRIDLRGAGGVDEEAAEQQVAVAAATAEPGLVFSDEPLEYSFLDAADIEAEVTIASVLLDDDALNDINVKISLNEGNLSVDPFSFGIGDGEVSGRVGLRPSSGDYTLDINVEASNLRIGALGSEGQDPATIPPLDARLVLSGQGASPHEIMTGANGSLRASQQGGQIDLQAAGVLFSDLVTSIFRAINPLAETETATALECGIYDVNVVDGVAIIDQLALQSDKVTIISSGTIDLETEIIDMTLSTRTREGFGVSLGGVVNSFLKLGGTLGAPSIGVDTAGSVTTTGAAVMTGGLSVLAKGLFDRVSAEADLCAALRDPESEAAPAN